MKSGFTRRDLRRENHSYRGTGGLSQKNGCCGFSPAFLDTETGIIYHSCFADGRPAPLHLLDGLPEELILTRVPDGRVTAVKGSIIAGFVQSGRFYTREEAAQTFTNMEPSSKTLASLRTRPSTTTRTTHRAPPLPQSPFVFAAHSVATTVLELSRLTLLSSWSLAYGSPYPRLWKKYCQSGCELLGWWAGHSKNLLSDSLG